MALYQDNSNFSNNSWVPGTAGGYTTANAPYLAMPGPGSYNQQIQQPSAQRQIVQPQSIPGRIVNTEMDIIPGEVPNDGSVGFFVQNDLQRIYAKTWGRDGLIHTNIYELVNPQATENNDAQNSFSLIMERLDNIEQTLSKMKPRSKPYYNKNEKKPKTEKEEQV